MSAIVAERQADGAVTVVPRRKWKAPITLAVLGLVSLFAFGYGSPRGSTTTFSFARPSDFFAIPNLTVPAPAVAIGFSVVALAIAAWSAFVVWQRRKPHWWVAAAAGVVLLSALLTWAGAGKVDRVVPLTGLLAAAMLASVPFVFGALAGTICERSGIINIAIEGQLLAGAFLAALVASATGNPYIGLIAAPVAGALVGAALAMFAVKYWVDQIVVGVVLNVLVIGITNFLFGTLLRSSDGLNRAMPLGTVPIPGLSKIPIIGPVLFNHNVLVYLMYVVVVVLHIMMFKSRWGLRMRSVGEHPKAADTVGIRVNRTRIRNTILGGAVAGLGGAFFTVAAGLAFGKEMTAGTGYIALAAMILGRWTPKGALAAALLFGFADSLRQQLGIIGSDSPSQFLAMVPYVATIFAVAGLVGRSRPPAAEGKPYRK